jgi:hypothetical protein
LSITRPHEASSTRPRPTGAASVSGTELRATGINLDDSPVLYRYGTGLRY